jgi:hypothetical protein
MNEEGTDMRKDDTTRRGVSRAGATVGLVALAAVIAALAASGSASGRTRAAPINKTPPSISGTAREGNTLNANAGIWTGSQPITFAGTWKRCDSDGNNCFAIPPSPQQQQQYTLTTADVGHRLRVTITASNSDGQSSATTKATAVVTAAPAAAPRNIAPPTISGTAQDGQVLTGDKGQWQGTEPIDYNLYWQRCNTSGGSCANISGATSSGYTLSSADVGNRIRLRVQASNRAGRTNAYSSASAVVASKGPNLPPGAIKLPDGKYSIPVTSVSRPELLIVSGLDFSPNPLRSRDSLITARFRILDTRGYVVRAALVLVTPLPYGWTTQPAETLSATDGWATVQMRATAQLPRKAAIVMFVRARKPGDFVLTGVSSRRLVQMLVDIP